MLTEDRASRLGMAVSAASMLCILLLHASAAAGQTSYDGGGLEFPSQRRTLLADLPSTLLAGQSLQPGGSLQSPNGQFRLVYQASGQLAIFEGTNPPAMVWQSGTTGTPFVARMTSSGTLELCSDATTCYSTLGNASAAAGNSYQLKLRNSGDLVVENARGRAMSIISHYFCPDLAGYVKLAQRDHPSDDLQPQVADNKPQGLARYLKQQCDADCRCVGFTSGGSLKSNFSLDMWPPFVYSQQCLYQKLVSVRAADCPGVQRNATQSTYSYTSLGSFLSSGQQMLPGQRIESPNNTFALVYRPEGNLVLYEGRDPARTVWQSDTAGKPAGFAVVDGQGYLTLCSSNTSCYYSKGSTPTQGAYKLQVTDAGDVQISEVTTARVAFSIPYFCPQVDGFERYQYQDDDGTHNYKSYPNSSPDALGQVCLGDCTCAGFSSDGTLKYNLTSQFWPNTTASNKCLYRKLNTTACGRPDLPPWPFPPSPPPAPPPPPPPAGSSTVTLTYGVLCGVQLANNLPLQQQFTTGLTSSLAAFFNVNNTQVRLVNQQFVAHTRRRHLLQVVSAMQTDAIVVAPATVLEQQLPVLQDQPSAALNASFVDAFKIDTAIILVAINSIMPPLSRPLPPAPPTNFAAGAPPGTPGGPPLPPANKNTADSGSSSVNGGLIAGVVVAVVVVLIASVGIAVWYVRAKRAAAAAAAFQSAEEPTTLLPSSKASPYLDDHSDVTVQLGAQPSSSDVDKTGSLAVTTVQVLPGGARTPLAARSTSALGHAYASLPMDLNAQPVLKLSGLIQGDPFLKATAQQYKWTDYSACAESVGVEAGLTDMQLDSMVTTSYASSNASATVMECPVLHLSCEQVQQQIELLQDGLLGRGGAALVFTGRWPSRFGPHGLLAVKVLKDAYDVSPLILQSFVYEARVLASIKHDNIVRMYGYCLELPCMCIIMELMPTSLERLIHPWSRAGLSPEPMDLARPQPSTTVMADASTLSPKQRSLGLSSAFDAQSSAAGSSSSAAAQVSTVNNNTAVAATPNAQAPTALTSPQTPMYAAAGGSLHAAGSSDALLGHTFTPASALSLASAVSKPSAVPTPSLTVQQVIQISADISAGLTYLHDRHVVATELLQAQASKDLELPTRGLYTPVRPSSSASCAGLEQRHDEEAAVDDADDDGDASELQGSRIVHRDLKPANVLISSNGRAKISDFGLARQHDATTVHTAHFGAGTLAYMSPELLMGRRAAGSGHDNYGFKPTNRVDIYSLGIMMWEMVSRKRPFEGMHEVELLAAVCSKVRPAIPVPPSKSRRVAGNTASAGPGSSGAVDATNDTPSGAHMLSPMHSGSNILSTFESLQLQPSGDWVHTAASWDRMPAAFVDLVRSCWLHREGRRPTAAQVHAQLARLMMSGNNCINSFAIMDLQQTGAQEL